MRAIIPTFFVFAFSIMVHAEVQSAAEFKQYCINNRIANCYTSVPEIEPGLQGDTSHCKSSSVQASYATACEAEVKTYCDGYNSTLASGLPVPSDIQLPSGCPGSKNVPAPKPRPPNKNVVDADIAKAKADLQACTNMQSTAQKCCGSPQSCGGKSTTENLQKLEDIVQDTQQNGDDDGLKQICSQARDAADTKVDLDSSYAGVCAAKHLSCSDACGQYWDKWNQVAASCKGDSCSELNSIVAKIYSQQSSCTTLTASEQILQDNATQQAINSRISKMCLEGVKANPDDPIVPPERTPSRRDQIAQNDPSPFIQSPPANPQPLAPTTPNQQVAAALPLGSSECGAVGNISACVNCAEHPEYPSCGGGQGSSGTASQVNNEGGSGGAKAGRGNPNASSMDVGSNSADHYDAASLQKAAAMGAASAINAMNAQLQASAGVFPPLDPKDVSGSLLARAQFVAAKSGVNTNIFTGERGGGGYTSPGGRSGSGSGFERSGINRGLAGFAIAQGQQSYVGMDLKRYLPGGQFGPKRISGIGVAQSEIGPMSTDMFQRVSLRFKLICVQHGLIDCN